MCVYVLMGISIHTLFSAVLDNNCKTLKMDMHSDWGKVFLNGLQHINKFNTDYLIIKNTNPGNIAVKNWKCWEFLLFCLRAFVDYHSLGQKVLKSRFIFWLWMSALKSCSNQPSFLLAQVLQISNFMLK